jgi:hypothetical protein
MAGLYRRGFLPCCKKSEATNSSHGGAIEVTAVVTTTTNQLVVDAVIIVSDSDIVQDDPVRDKRIPTAPPAPFIQDAAETLEEGFNTEN